MPTLEVETNGLAVNTAGVNTLGTGVATALGTNVGTAGSVLVNGGALGTPSSGTATNLSGTAASLTAGTVTTNANLTGPITSTGNATAIAAQTGTGSTLVTNTGPTITNAALVTPALGTPASGVGTNLTSLPAGQLTGTVSNARLAWNGANAAFSPSNPAATTSTTGVMSGLGVTCVFTPGNSTRMMLIFQGAASNGTASDGGKVTVSWGLGTAPANADALTITAGSFIIGHSYTIATAGNTNFTLIGAANSNVGTFFTATGVGSGTGTATQGIQAGFAHNVVLNNGSVSSLSDTFCIVYVATGLTPGSTYWADLLEAAVTGGTFTINNIRFQAIEI